MKREHILIVALGILGITVLALSYMLYTSKKSSEAAQAEREAQAAVQEARIAELEGVLMETKTLLEAEVSENESLSSDLLSEKERNDAFDDQIEKISGTVGVLDKLAKTDKELLEKYSKVYFLNEHYIPKHLSEIDHEFVYSENVRRYFLAQAYPFLEDMLEDAREDGVELWVLSAYRSFDEQESLKGAYTVRYGSGANTFSADQGYSEHQLGTTLDFTTRGLNEGLDGFDTTEAYTWLTKNAYKYGFVLSYPKNNAYYIYEPWHWRFVGEDLAETLHEDGKNFYDMDQREINEYLVSLFD